MKRLILFLLILSGALFSASQARAGFFTFSSGDLLMGFWVSSGSGAGATEDYLVDLGAVSNFEGLSPGGSISILSNTNSTMGNIGADLTNTFGSNWIDNPGLNWGLAAVVSTNVSSQNIVFASDAENTPGTIQAGWPSTSNSNLAPAHTAINGAYNGATAFTTSTNTKDAIVEPDGASGSWDSYMYGVNGNTLAFNYFNQDGSNLGVGGLFDDSSTTAGDDPLDLFELVPGTSTTKQTNYLATFSIDSSGDLTVKNLEGVPEPSTYGLLAFGAGALFLAARRGRLRPHDRSLLE